MGFSRPRRLVSFHYVSPHARPIRPRCRPLLGSLHPLKHEDRKGHKVQKKENSSFVLFFLCARRGLCASTKCGSPAPPPSYGGAAHLVHRRRNCLSANRRNSQ